VTVEPLHPQGGIESRYRGPIDAEGDFRVGPLPEGNYRIRAEAPGLLQRTAAYAKADGQAVNVIIEYGGIAFGRVVAPRALEQDVEVTVWSVDSTGRVTPYIGSVKVVFEKDKNHFEIDGLSPGTYQLRAASPPWAPARSEPFSIGAGELRQGVDLTLTTGGSIARTVVGARVERIEAVRITAV
jgi:hypothetical protein